MDTTTVTDSHLYPTHSMKPKDIFTLIVRLLGLFFIYLAIKEVPIIFVGPGFRIFFGALLTLALYLAAGWWMLGGAPFLVNRAYPSADGPQENTPSDG